MVDRHESRRPAHPGDGHDKPDARQGQTSRGDDPLVTLARIVRGRRKAGDDPSMIDSAGAARKRDPAGQPAAPQAELAEDPVTELLDGIQSSFSTIPDAASRDVRPSVGPQAEAARDEEASPASDISAESDASVPAASGFAGPPRQWHTHPPDEERVYPAKAEAKDRADGPGIVGEHTARSLATPMAAGQWEESSPYRLRASVRQPATDEGEGFRRRLTRAARAGDSTAEWQEPSAPAPARPRPPERFGDLSSPRVRRRRQAVTARPGTELPFKLVGVAGAIAITAIGVVAFVVFGAGGSDTVEQVAAVALPIDIAPGPAGSSDGHRAVAAGESPIADRPSIPESPPADGAMRVLSGGKARSAVGVHGTGLAGPDGTRLIDRSTPSDATTVAELGSAAADGTPATPGNIPSTSDAPPMPIPVARPGAAAVITTSGVPVSGAPSAAVPGVAAMRSGSAASTGPGLAVSASSAGSSLTEAQRAMLVNASNYFNGFRTMEGEFVQVGPSGEQSQGVFAISKPGKIRFRYKPPTQLDVISDGRSVAVRDNRAGTQDLYPLSKTPLRYLLSDEIDLTSSSVVGQVREEADLVSVVINEKSSLVNGKLTLIFDRRSYELRQWIVTDAQGLDTSVAIFNTVTGIEPDPENFRIYISPRNTDRR